MTSAEFEILNRIEARLEQIVAILAKAPIVRPSSYSNSISYRTVLNKKTGQYEQREDKGNPEDTFSDRP